MKIKEMNQKEISKMNKLLGECEVITFDPKKMQKKIQKAYELRDKAHTMLLESDILLDGVLKELNGEKDSKDIKTTSVEKGAKNKRLGSKV